MANLGSAEGAATLGAGPLEIRACGVIVRVCHTRDGGIDVFVDREDNELKEFRDSIERPEPKPITVDMFRCPNSDKLGPCSCDMHEMKIVPRGDRHQDSP